MPTCQVSGVTFTHTEAEHALSKKLQVPLPNMLSKYYFRHLGAFWQHFALYKRACDRTGQEIISVFDAHCPYPVWFRDEWMQHANPPVADFDFSRTFFEQLWELFQTCPIPHNVGQGN